MGEKKYFHVIFSSISDNFSSFSLVQNVLPLTIKLTGSVTFWIFSLKQNLLCTVQRHIEHIFPFIIISYHFLQFQTTCCLSFFPNILQFTTDQNLLIKKDIFGAAHFPMTCQPFWASCHLPSQQCGWGLIPCKLCELWAIKREVGSQKERHGKKGGGVRLVHLYQWALGDKHELRKRSFNLPWKTWQKTTKKSTVNTKLCRNEFIQTKFLKFLWELCYVALTIFKPAAVMFSKWKIFW